jgi:lysosomal alpha-mannosidase
MLQLPVNLHLLTVQDNSILGSAGTMLLRIDHSFEVGEDPVYSQPVQLNLDALFSSITLVSCTEMTLTANQPV